MKPSSILLIAAMLCATLAAAQSDDAQAAHEASRIYARFGLGYGFVHAGQAQINGAGVNGSEDANGNVFSKEQKPASFGSGLSAVLTGGYMINRHIGVELGIHAILAPTKYTYSGYDPVFGLSRTYVTEIKADLPVYIIPALVLTTGDKLQLYGRAGLVLPVSDKLTRIETQTDNTPGQTTRVITSEIKNHFNLGLQGSVGVSYVLNDHLSLWGEVNAISRSAYTKRAEITGYTEDGIDGLGSFSTNQKVTEYDFQTEAEFPIPATEPDKKPAYSLPFGSVGMTIGLKYAF